MTSDSVENLLISAKEKEEILLFSSVLTLVAIEEAMLADMIEITPWQEMRPKAIKIIIPAFHQMSALEALTMERRIPLIVSTSWPFEAAIMRARASTLFLTASQSGYNTELPGPKTPSTPCM